jgi:phage gpG-like protein
MSSATIQGMDKLQNTLSELIKATNANAIASRVTTLIRKATARALTKETSPFTGAKWKPLTPEYAKRKKKYYANKRILERDGNLKKIVSRKVGEGERVIGTTAKSAKGYPYPAVHQFGSRNGLIPARPFLPIDGKGALAPSVKKEIDADLEALLRDIIKGAGI